MAQTMRGSCRLAFIAASELPVNPPRQFQLRQCPFEGHNSIGPDQASGDQWPMKLGLLPMDRPRFDPGSERRLDWRRVLFLGGEHRIELHQLAQSEQFITGRNHYCPVICQITPIVYDSAFFLLVRRVRLAR